jgi:hypothetical protein
MCVRLSIVDMKIYYTCVMFLLYKIYKKMDHNIEIKEISMQ